MLEIYNFRNSLILIFFVFFNTNVLGKENKLFWDGGDWNRVAESAKHDHNLTFKINAHWRIIKDFGLHKLIFVLL